MLRRRVLNCARGGRVIVEGMWDAADRIARAKLARVGGGPYLISDVIFATAHCPLCGDVHEVEVRPLVEVRLQLVPA